MWSPIIALLFLGFAQSQLVDNFQCPDEFEGYYPHLFSCDRYWKCLEGQASLETCGNGLAFADLDPTFTTENCDYIYNVDCGNRTELEPAISAPNCPRLYGTFPDSDDCTAFYNCRNGLANRYNCAPGLAFDPEDRVCKWADQVDVCKKMMNDEEKEKIFTCPQTSTRGIYSKHAHPEDCRQYFVCISGSAREYGCPLGSVFKITTSGEDGVCADPADVPECKNYYGDLEFQPEELVKAGVDPEAVGVAVKAESVSRSRANSNRVSNTFTEIQLPDYEDDNDVFVEEPVLVPAPIVRNSNRAQPPQFRNRPQIRNRPQVPTTTTTTTTTTIRTTAAPAQSVDFIDDDGERNPNGPAVVKAGEDYYYYYYYYDDDELPEEV